MKMSNASPLQTDIGVKLQRGGTGFLQANPQGGVSATWGRSQPSNRKKKRFSTMRVKYSSRRGSD